MDIGDKTAPTEACDIDEIQQHEEPKTFELLPVLLKETKVDEIIFTQPLRPENGLRNPPMPSIQPSGYRPSFNFWNKGINVVGGAVSNVLSQTFLPCIEIVPFEDDRQTIEELLPITTAPSTSHPTNLESGLLHPLMLQRNSADDLPAPKNVLPSYVIPTQAQMNIMEEVFQPTIPSPEDFAPKATKAEEPNQFGDEEESKQSDVKDPAECQTCEAQAKEKIGEKRKATEAAEDLNVHVKKPKRELPPRKCKRPARYR